MGIWSAWLGQLTLLWAQGGGAPAPGPGGPGGPAAPINPTLDQYFFLATMILVAFLFIVVIPSLNEKKQKEKLNALKKGTRIITIGGIHATVQTVAENQETLEILVDKSRGVTLTINRTAIAQVLAEENKEKEKEKAKS